MYVLTPLPAAPAGRVPVCLGCGAGPARHAGGTQRRHPVPHCEAAAAWLWDEHEAGATFCSACMRRSCRCLWLDAESGPQLLARRRCARRWCTGTRPCSSPPGQCWEPSAWYQGQKIACMPSDWTRTVCRMCRLRPAQLQVATLPWCRTSTSRQALMPRTLSSVANGCLLSLQAAERHGHNLAFPCAGG